MNSEAENPASEAQSVLRSDVTQARPAASRRTRIWSAVVAIGCGTVLGVAIKLQPDPRGYGTHQQLGSAPCGMILSTGLPCPTCGMTTAFSHTVRGSWWSAFWAQPAGFVLALTTIAALFVSLRGVATGRVPRVLIDDRTVFRLFMALLVLLVSGWAFKLLVGLADHSLPIRSVRL